MRKTRLTIATAALSTALLALTACNSSDNGSADAGSTDNNDSGTTVLQVSAKEDSCEVSTAEAPSGAVTFEITNDGTQTTEFYVLAEDGLRIVSERENIPTGSSADLTVSLQPGTYFTACKPGMRGANVGETEFTVTGEPVEVSADEQERLDAVVTDYVNFVKNEVAELTPKVEEFAQAYMDGDDEKARELYATTRVHYERIEPVAESLGVYDPRIDYREIDYLAEADLLKEDDETFTEWLGFHRIEKDLWPPAEDAVQPDGSSAHEGWEESSEEDRQRIGQTLIDDVNALYDIVHDDAFIDEVNISTVSNGASGLLEEIALTKVTCEENWWSHYDLWDFQANLEGARIAFDLVALIAEDKSEEGAELVKEIDEEFNNLQAELDKYGSLEEGYVLYDEVDRDQQRELVAQIDATREPLSKLTSAVLGID